MSVGVLYIFSLIIVGLAYSIGSPGLLAFAMSLFFFGFSYIQYQKEGIYSINPGNLYSFSMGLAGLGNYMGMLSVDGESRKIYFIYASEDHLMPAILIAFFGSSALLFGYFSSKNPIINLPKINSYIGADFAASRLPFIAVLAIAGRIFKIIPSLGTIEGFIYLLPHGIIFFLARLGAQKNGSKYIKIALFIVVLETIRALLFDYLRMHIVLPSVAFMLGYLIGKGSVRSLLTLQLVPLYGIILIFFSFFTFLGQNRQHFGSGFQRIAQFGEMYEQEEGQEQTLLLRMSNFNQLSQVVRVVEEDGFYQGETLSYLTFAFIPRFIWPDKPLIQMGAWFAHRIGRGYIDKNGRYRNAINMTIPGEFYLNFGWVGMFIGCFLFGKIIKLIWNTTNFWSAPNNALGSFFTFYMLYLGLFNLGANLSILVTLIAMYLLSVVVSKILGNGARV